MDFEQALVAALPTLRRLAEAYCHDADADDLTAETVLHALKAGRSYDPSKPLIAWIRAIMRNIWLNRQHSFAVSHTQRLGDWDTLGGEAADQRARCREILRTVLSHRNNIAVATLIDFAKGYSIAEIAEARNIPQGTVKRRIHDARKMLRKMINE